MLLGLKHISVDAPFVEHAEERPAAAMSSMVSFRWVEGVQCLQKEGGRVFESESEKSRSNITIVVVLGVVLAILLGITWLMTS